MAGRRRRDDKGIAHPLAVSEMTLIEARTGRILKRLVPVPGGYRDVHDATQGGA